MSLDFAITLFWLCATINLNTHKNKLLLGDLKKNISLYFMGLKLALIHNTEFDEFVYFGNVAGIKFQMIHPFR